MRKLSNGNVMYIIVLSVLGGLAVIQMNAYKRIKELDCKFTQFAEYKGVFF